MEVDGHLDGGFEFADDGCRPGGIHQAGHILEGDDFRAEAFHLDSEVDEIFVGEYLFGSCGSFFLFAEEGAEETFLFGCFSGSFLLGIDGIAYGGVGDSAEFVDETD